jgi:hypothetical protein
MDTEVKGSKKLRINLRIIIAPICLLILAGLLFFLLQERSQRIKTEGELIRSEEAKRIIGAQLSKTRFKMTQLKEKTDVLSGQLKEEKENYQVLLSTVGEKDKEIKELSDSLSSEKKQRANFANELAQLKEDYVDLEKKFKKTEQKIVEFDKQKSKYSAKAGVELKKIVVKSKEKLTGKVLVVNRDFHFLVIDLGRKNNISVSDEFVVYNGSLEVGRVQIERVYEAMSTASILSGSQEDKISEQSIVKSF